MKSRERFLVGRVYKELREEVSDDTIVLAGDNQGYYLDVAKDAEELKFLVQSNSPKLGYVICENSSEGNVAYEVDKQLPSSDIDLLGNISIRNYAIRCLMMEADGTLNGLERAMVYNNRFTFGLYELLKEHGIPVELSTVDGDFKDNGRLPMFRLLTVHWKNTTLFITGALMSFLTSAGALKIHDGFKDAELDSLVDMFVIVYGVDGFKVREALTAHSY